MSINKYNSTSGQLERIDGIIATDATPISESINPVQSGGVYTALASKQNILTFDSTPTSASSNPVTSGGIYTALGTKANESMIGDAWTASTTYGPEGNTSGYPVYCINDNVLYKCIQEHTGAAYEPPNATYWEATDVNTEITALNNSLTGKKTVELARYAGNTSNSYAAKTLNNGYKFQDFDFMLLTLESYDPNNSSRRRVPGAISIFLPTSSFVAASNGSYCQMINSNTAAYITGGISSNTIYMLNGSSSNYLLILYGIKI